jgi:hypothetical protein
VAPHAGGPACHLGGPVQVAIDLFGRHAQGCWPRLNGPGCRGGPRPWCAFQSS